VSTSTTLRALVGGGIALTLLTGCGAEKSDDAEDVSLPATSSAAATSSSAAPQSGGKSAHGAGNAAPSVTAGSGATASGDNERGNLVLALGQEGGVQNEAGTQLLTFAVDAITVDPPCTADWQEYGTPLAPGHHLVAVQLRVATSPAVTEDDYLSLSAYDFNFIGADGITVDEVSSAATYGCLEDGQEFTTDTLGPGQKYAGAVVLDLPAAGGSLVLKPYWGQTGGWEYTF
jgi:hypothetical protein